LSDPNTEAGSSHFIKPTSSDCASNGKTGKPSKWQYSKAKAFLTEKLMSSENHPFWDMAPCEIRKKYQIFQPYN
jgi:hypothetical protein